MLLALLRWRTRAQHQPVSLPEWPRVRLALQALETAAQLERVASGQFDPAQFVVLVKSHLYFVADLRVALLDAAQSGGGDAEALRELYHDLGRSAQTLERLLTRAGDH